MGALWANGPRTARDLSFLFLILSCPLHTHTHTYTYMHYTTTHVGSRPFPTGAVPRSLVGDSVREKSSISRRVGHRISPFQRGEEHYHIRQWNLHYTFGTNDLSSWRAWNHQKINQSINQKFFEDVGGFSPVISVKRGWESYIALSGKFFY